MDSYLYNHQSLDNRNDFLQLWHPQSLVLDLLKAVWATHKSDKYFFNKHLKQWLALIFSKNQQNIYYYSSYHFPDMEKLFQEESHHFLLYL